MMRAGVNITVIGLPGQQRHVAVSRAWIDDARLSNDKREEKGERKTDYACEQYPAHSDKLDERGIYRYRIKDLRGG